MTTAREARGQISDLDFELAETYTAIVLGMDALYRQKKESYAEESLDREGLVPINLTDVTPRRYTEWAHVQEDLRELRRKYTAISGEVRRNYMEQQISSLIALSRWTAGEPLTFREQVREFLFVNENPITHEQMAELHGKLDRALAARGYQGSLADKVERWQADRMVPGHEVEGVLVELLGEARNRVAEMMFPEMADVEMVPVIVQSVPYSAYCDYVGRRMYLNGDLRYTYPALKHLVCHEAFPGHTTHMYVREQSVRNGTLPADAGLVITDTASSPVFEGIGDNGMAFIEWEDEDDRIYRLFQLIRSVAGANAAHLLHAQGASTEEVADYLRQACFADEAYVYSRLRFIRHPLRAPFIYAYWRGYEAVRDAYLRAAAIGQLQRFFSFLYRNMLSADTVRQFT